MSKIRFVVTGFGPFGNIRRNPTTDLIEHLQENGLEGCSLKDSIDSLSIVEVSAEGASEHIDKLWDEIAEKDKSDCCFQFVHFGVDANSTQFKLEVRAANEATFRIPDERQQQPEQCAIVPSRGAIESFLEPQTVEAIKSVANRLYERGFNVDVSTDAGRFVCNYLYFKSLDRCYRENEKCGRCVSRSLFVHIPPTSVVDLETRTAFAKALLEELAQCGKGE